MKTNFSSLDYPILERLYHAKSKELERALLSGTAWDEVRIKRKQLSELSYAMHNKLQYLNQTPAEAPTRSERRR